MCYWYNDRETVMAILKLYDTLCHHCFCNFHEACNISTFDVVDITIFIGPVFDALLVNTVHNLVQTSINICFTPGEVHSVLAHFQTRCCYTTGINSFTRSKQHLLLNEEVDSFWSASHIRDFTYTEHAIVYKVLCIFTVKLVLSRTR